MCYSLLYKMELDGGIRRKGSIHEREEANPLKPPKNAKTGVMQQSEAAVAVKSPAIKLLLFFVVVVMIKV